MVDIDAGAFSLIPAGLLSAPPSLAPTFGLCFQGFKEAFSSGADFGRFLIIILTFLYVDIFDTLGTLSGVATKAKMLDENGELPGVQGALTADAIGTCAGAILGTSTVTTFVESAAGVEEGGRTGLTAMTTGVCSSCPSSCIPLWAPFPACHHLCPGGRVS